MSRKYWTKEETEELVKLYPTATCKDLAKRFNCKTSQIYNIAHRLKLRKDQDWLFQYYKDNFKGYPRTQFRKGCKSWNKGTKGLMCGGVQTQFKKGQAPHNTKPIGYRSLRDGYQVEKTAQGFKFVHVLMWEAANGPVPDGLFVVFKDRNKNNLTLDNLELIDRHQHMKRNAVHNLPPELLEVVHVKKSLTRKINQLEKNGTK